MHRPFDSDLFVPSNRLELDELDVKARYYMASPPVAALLVGHLVMHAMRSGWFGKTAKGWVTPADDFEDVRARERAIFAVVNRAPGAVPPPRGTPYGDYYAKFIEAEARLLAEHRLPPRE